MRGIKISSVAPAGPRRRAPAPGLADLGWVARPLDLQSHPGDHAAHRQDGADPPGAFPRLHPRGRPGKPFRRSRRCGGTLGLYAFLYASLHFLTFVGLDYRFDLGLIRQDLFEKRYAVVGFTAFLILLPLAITSTQGWRRRLGRNWSRLHRFVYVAASAGGGSFRLASQGGHPGAVAVRCRCAGAPGHAPAARGCDPEQEEDRRHSRRQRVTRFTPEQANALQRSAVTATPRPSDTPCVRRARDSCGRNRTSLHGIVGGVAAGRCDGPSYQ